MFYNKLMEAATASTETTSSGSLLVTVLPFVVVLLVMYLLMIRPQRKKEKEMNNMRNSLQVGDTVVTIGGITGIVTNLHEDEFILETAGERTKMCFKRWAIQEVKKLEM